MSKAKKKLNLKRERESGESPKMFFTLTAYLEVIQG